MGAVRFMNKDICMQVIRATIAGDIVETAAYSHELPKYGLKVGLTNYAAAYCVGLLIARRTLKKFGLDEEYVGQEEVTGEDYNVEAGEGARPFKANLDVGIKRTSTGAKVFAALKGACDGGMELDSEVLQKYIMGEHVAEYMSEMRDEEPEKYNEHFSTYVAEGIDPDDLADLYPSVHEAIRENPEHEKKPRSKPADAKKWKFTKLSYEQKKANLKEKLLALKSA